MRRTLSAACLTVLLAAAHGAPVASASAQEAPPPVTGHASVPDGRFRRGQRVRIVAPAIGSARIDGTVVEIGPDSLFVHADSPQGARVGIPVASICTADIRRGRNHALGALVGMGLGIAVLGGGSAIIGALTPGCRGDECYTRESGARFYFLLGSLVGAPLGLVTGAVIGVVEWERVVGGASMQVGADRGGAPLVAFSIPTR